ncbi:hypothetical protein N8198_09775 [Gammaproteobacteria bacterium]|nr:hypothetical protein [Gammaproteobacteria bacterium]
MYIAFVIGNGKIAANGDRLGQTAERQRILLPANPLTVAQVRRD